MAGPSHDPALYRHRDVVPIRRALVSVSDKTDLLRLAEALAGAGVEIVSTGSTAATIRDAGFAVTDVASVTGFPESLDGRVKTLHPGVHAGLLADLRLEDHVQQLAELGIEPFELVVVNLYPFVETVRSGAQGDDVVEQIDIGGPAMVRASAKNFSNVAIVVSPESYPAIVEALGAGGTTLTQRRELAARAFAHTCEYDKAVATWFAEETLAGSDLPQHLTIKAERLETLRYGENSHQRAAIYTRVGAARHRAGHAGAGQGDVVQQLRRCGCRPPRRVRHGASRPSRSSSTRTRAASPLPHPTRWIRSPAPICAPTSAIRCRRSAASSPRTARSR